MTSIAATPRISKSCWRRWAFAAICFKPSQRLSTGKTPSWLKSWNSAHEFPVRKIRKTWKKRQWDHQDRNVYIKFGRMMNRIESFQSRCWKKTFTKGLNKILRILTHHQWTYALGVVASYLKSIPSLLVSVVPGEPGLLAFLNLQKKPPAEDPLKGQQKVSVNG